MRNILISKLKINFPVSKAAMIVSNIKARCKVNLLNDHQIHHDSSLTDASLSLGPVVKTVK
jgi:hypothetical protein